MLPLAVLIDSKTECEEINIAFGPFVRAVDVFRSFKRIRGGSANRAKALNSGLRRVLARSRSFVVLVARIKDESTGRRPPSFILSYWYYV